MNKRPFNALQLAFVGLCLSCVVHASVEDATEYSIGVVPQFDARRTQAVWRPLLSELERSTGLRFRLVGSAGIPEFEKQFMAGHFDFAYMNPYHVVKAISGVGYVPLTRDVGHTLYGVIVVRNDSPINEVSELAGRTVAFPAPNALGASLVPRAELKRIHNIEVEPRYVQSHSSVYLNVALGHAAAGGGVQKTLSQQPSSIRSKLRVVYETREMAAHPFTAHPRVAPEIREKVKRAMLGLGDSERGRKLLAPVPIGKVGAATIEDYLPLELWGLEEFDVIE